MQRLGSLPRLLVCLLVALALPRLVKVNRISSKVRSWGSPCSSSSL